MIKNTWYIAAHADELTEGGILGRKIAGEAMVFVRDNDGNAYAVEDRCPHRLAPLSLGEWVDGAIQCGYHGAQFDRTGTCLRVPGQDKVPSDVRIRTFPVKETYGYVWVWPGDPALSSDERAIPDWLEYGLPPSECYNGHILGFKSDYRLLVDNLLDPTHAEFVHRSSFGSSDWQVSREAEKDPRERSEEFTVDMRDDGIDFTFQLRNVKGGPCFGKLYGMKIGRNDGYDGPLDIRMDVIWTPPALFLYSTFTKPAGANDDEGLRLTNLHLITPETGDTCHYLYRTCASGTGGNPEIAKAWYDVDQKAFREDQRIIEGQQRVAGAGDLFEKGIRNFEGDVMSVTGRNILNRMARLETGIRVH